MIPREVAGSAIGQHREAEGQGMGAHVPAVGQQRHGVVEPAATDLRHHHDDGEQHGPAGLLFGQGFPSWTTGWWQWDEARDGMDFS